MSVEPTTETATAYRAGSRRYFSKGQAWRALARIAMKVGHVPGGYYDPDSTWAGYVECDCGWCVFQTLGGTALDDKVQELKRLAGA